MSDAPTPADDKSILDDAKLWRRIPLEQMTKDDSAPGGQRPESGNFDEFDAKTGHLYVIVPRQSQSVGPELRVYRVKS